MTVGPIRIPVPKFVPGMVVRVAGVGGVSGRAFVGRMFTLTEWKVINGETCWRAPDAWSSWMSARRGFTFDLHLQEGRLEFVSAANIKVSWDEMPWRPHEDVIPDPRPGRAGMLVNVWDPVDPWMDGGRVISEYRQPQPTPPFPTGRRYEPGEERE